MVLPVTVLALAGTYAGRAAGPGGRARGATRAHSLVAELRRLPAPPRALAARVSLPQAYRACEPPLEGARAAPTPFCGAARSNVAPPGLIELLGEASGRSRRQADAEALHVLALADLLWADTSGATLDRAIRNLRTVARLAPRPAPALGDLAAALLTRAERRGEARDVFEAAEMAARALRADSTGAAARFDLALALTRLGLVDEAVRAWDEYLAAEPGGRWAAEARRRRAEVVAAAVPPRFDPSDPDVSAAVARAPQEARLNGWNAALRAWGAAVIAGDSATAARSLAAARTIGHTLEARGGDATLADAVRVIEAARGNSARTRSLARGHHAFAEAYAAYSAGQHATAMRGFSLAIGAPGVLGAWARTFAGGTEMYVGQPARAISALRSVIAHADSARHPALVARARWMLAHTLNRVGRTEAALHELRASAAGFARTGETEHLGAALSSGGRSAYLLGDSRVTADAVRDALTTLRAYTSSVWRYNALYMATLAAEREGFRETARRTEDEAVLVAARTDNPALAADALLMRARLALGAGAEGRERAAADAAAAVRAVAAAPPSPARTWVAADLQMLGVALRPPAERARRVATLDSVVSVFEQPLLPPRLIPALLARADSRLLGGDVSGGSSDLRRAVALLASEQRTTDSLPLRASLVDAARSVVDHALTHHVRTGANEAALQELELGRMGLTHARSPTTRTGRLRAPPGEVSVAYALVGDTLLTWTIRDTTVRMALTEVDRAELARTVERVREALERRTADEARGDLAALYDQLIRPVAPRLGPAGTGLVIVPDGELTGVPFATLFDRYRDRVLAEDHPIRLALSALDEPTPSVLGASPGAGRVLVVADPAIDREAYSVLGRLTGARAEARVVAGTYPRVRVLAGAEASPRRVSEELTRASLVHYAGHAVFDDERPERSVLLLAPEPPSSAAGGGSSLRAEQIAALDLRHVRLVVLSACETLRSATGRGGGFSGLAGAFTAAGAGGVLGALWRVDDGATAAFMQAFHHAYARHGDATRALRAAQLELLHSLDPALRSPAVWGAFQYIGRRRPRTISPEGGANGDHGADQVLRALHVRPGRGARADARADAENGGPGR